MNTTFSFYRIKHLLLADWIENKKSVLLGAGVLFIGLISIILLIGIDSVKAQGSYFFISGFFVFIYYCRFIGKKIHQFKAIYYTLPAGNIEKYTTFMLEGLAFFLGFFFIFEAGLFTLKLFFPDFILITPSELYRGVSSISLLIFVESLIFLSHLTFRKNATLICFAGIALFVIIIGGIFSKLILANNFFHSFFTSASFDETYGVMKQLISPALLVASIVVLYIGYIKLKVKQLR